MAKIVVQEIPCSTASELLQRLSPQDENFNNQNGAWLFRGHGKEEWKLIPSLFRKENSLCSFTNRKISDYSDLLLLERDLTIQFFEIADKRGLVVPDDSQGLRTFFERLKSSDENVRRGVDGWRIKDGALSLIALAQHYGVPTRLLDWTTQAFIAAFFAAEKASELLENKLAKSSERLAIWAFYFPEFGRQDEESRRLGLIRTVTAPKATNTNLKAQQGLFTLLNSIWLGDFSNGKFVFSEAKPFYSREAISEIEYLTDLKNGYPPLDEILIQMEEKVPYPRSVEGEIW